MLGLCPCWDQVFTSTSSWLVNTSAVMVTEHWGEQGLIGSHEQTRPGHGEDPLTNGLPLDWPHATATVWLCWLLEFISQPYWVA